MLVADQLEVLLRQREHDGDGVELGDDHESPGVRGVDDVPLVHLAHPHPPGDGRGDVRVVELRPGIFDGGLIGLHGGHHLIRQEPLGVVTLLIEDPLVDQVLVTLEDESRVGELGVVLRLFRDGLVQRGLERARVDLREQLPFLHVLALGERHLVELSVDAGLHRHGVVSLHGSQPVQVNRDIFLLDLPGDDGHGHVRIGSAPATMTARPTPPAFDAARPGPGGAAGGDPRGGARNTMLPRPTRQGRR